MHNLLGRHHATYSLFGIEEMTNSESRVDIAALVSTHALGRRSQEATTIRDSWRGVPLSGPAAAEVAPSNGAPGYFVLSPWTKTTVNSAAFPEA